MSFQIANHAIRMVWNNLEDVLKLTLVPYLLITLVGLALSYAFTGTIDWRGQSFTVEINEAQGAADVLPLAPQEFIGLLIYIAIYLPLLAWLAVGWHRFVLAEEYPDGFMPRNQPGRVWPYVTRFIAVFLVMVAGIVAIGLIAAALSVVSQLAAALGAIVAAVWVLVFYLRMSLVFPAVSIDRTDFGIMAALEATKGHSGKVLGAMAVLFLYTLVGLVAAALVAAFLPFLQTPFEIIFEWVILVVGISLLTTLYGVIVQGRTLN